METTVMIGEKPKVASRIANALGNYDTKTNRGVKNYIVKTDERKIIIAPAVGHIFNLDQIGDGWDYPVFDVEWKPTFETTDSADYMKKYYNNLRDQLDKADNYINACDFDLEGCLHPKEKVIIKKDEEILTKDVGDLIDDIIDEEKVGESDGFEYAQPDIEIIGMDDWKNRFQNVEKVMRRPADETYLQIKVFNGREVKVSKNHPMLIATKNGLEHREARNIEEGDYVLASKKVPSNESKKEIDTIDLFDETYIHDFKQDMGIMPAEMKNYVDKSRKQCLNYRYNDRMPKNIFLDLETHLGVSRKDLTISSYKGSTRLPAKLKLDRELGRFIGLYLAEGCIDSEGFIGLYFGPEENDLVEEVQEFLKNRIETEGKVRKRLIEGSYGDSKCWEVGTKSKILRELLIEFNLGKESGDKRLPEWILSAPEEFKKGVFSGYWDGDGSLFVDENDERAIAAAGSKSRELLDQFFYLLQSKGVNPSFQRWKERDMTNLTIGKNEDVVKAAEAFLDVEPIFTKELESASGPQNGGALNRIPKCLAMRQGTIEGQNYNIESQLTIANSSITGWEDEMEGYKDGDTTFLEVKSIEENETEADYFYDFQTESRNYQHGNGIISHNSVIGAMVLKEIADAPEERIERMKFSTLTPGDLQEAFDNLEDFDKGMTEAGITRHILDYYYGINVSRALMKAVRDNDRYKTLSTGRVQGPTLKVLADREKEIQEFDPTPYWELYLIHDEFEAQWKGDEDRIWDEEKANDYFNEVYGQTEAEVTNVKVNNYTHKPPIPFNLTGLQSEASSQFRISPKKTQSIAQTLYENGLISYPRTESQKLPPKLGYKNILNKLKGQKEYDELAKKVLKKDKKDNLYTTQGSKEDDAHPAIYPTGESPGAKLSKQEKKVYDLIVKRFFAVFGKAAKRQSLTFTLDVKEHEFKAKSKVTKEKNWYALYEPYVKVDSADLPDMEEGQTLKVEDFRLDDKETQPPNRYSQSKIVNELEKRDLGTKATRADTVDRLYSRNYIEEEPIEVTDLGLAIVNTLEDYCPNIVSEELTREFEDKMEEIREEKNSREEVLDEARTELGDILNKFKEKQKQIGSELVDTIDSERERRRRLGPCNVENCDGTLKMIKANGSKFVGCSEYPDCENTYPLPNNGDIKSTNEICEECGTPKIFVKRKKGKDYSMCIDPDCSTKDDW